MPDRMHFQLEIAGETATLYVSGSLDQFGISTLLDACSALPLQVRTLRVDMHALGMMTAEATAAVRHLLRHWRETRQGEFRLSTSYLVATYSEVEVPATRTAPSPSTLSAVGDIRTAACF